MAKEYKPDRAVTSDKIRLEIKDLFDKKYHGSLSTTMNSWKRKFKRRLPESRGFVRGFVGYAYGSSLSGKSNEFHALAISDETDTILQSVYFVDNCDAACKELGVNEIIFNGD